MKTARIISTFIFVVLLAGSARGGEANRLTYLDGTNPFYPDGHFPKLTTPQWVGEPGVDAVVILAVDDMREIKRYEIFLRPILDRLKKIDGRAALSIMTCQAEPLDPQLQAWLQEGVSLEVHTLAHPCPLLAEGNFAKAADTVNGCIDLMNKIPGNKPVAYRMPCCDSMNSLSPRFFAEIFKGTSQAGNFLAIDSSVMNIMTKEPDLRRYVPFPSFATTIEDYPYPYVIGNLCWEFPAAVPSDWEAQHVQGTNNPKTVADWEAELDAIVLKQGVFNFIFHPYGWIKNSQMVEFIDYAEANYGKRVKFLNFREVLERLNKNLLAGQPLRAANGQDNGVRLLDVDNDGVMDVVVGNQTRIWKKGQWTETPFPAATKSAQFGILQTNGMASVITKAGGWNFDGEEWVKMEGLVAEGGRLRDVDKDGRCEWLKGNKVFAWSPEERLWKKSKFAVPEGVDFDNPGLRFADVDGDGFDDIVFSDEKGFGVYTFLPKKNPLGFEAGWTREVTAGKRDDPDAIPMISRSGAHPNNGAWFKHGHLWVQNEDTAKLPAVVDRRSYEELLTGGQPKAKSPQESLACMKVRPGFKVELVASEPLTKSPVAFDWGADGKLWVVEMGDYPLGVDGKGKPGGIVRFLEDTNGDGIYDKSTVFLEGVNFPNGIIPWHKGVIVSAAPEIFYAEDTDGDGKADLRKVLFTGFREGNQQHRANGFDYGLDNWLYGANGDSGGDILSVLTGKKTSISGRDFRLRPDDGAFETQAGEAQFGRHRDDWGNWFGNNNAVWLWHYFLPSQYLARNPHLAAGASSRTLAQYADATRVFPISRTLQRFNDPSGANHLTSGNSAMPYRDELFGPEFANSIFISEPVHNLIHREVLEPDGVTFTSHRAADEQGTEFLSSSDNWFRPTQTKVGPDGALYVADMYRLVIEHPQWIPAEIQKQYNLRAGEDKGRIYRVYPENVTLRKIPRLDTLNTSELTAALDSPNGWQRDTAQRLLVHAQDSTAIKPLTELAKNSSRPKTRLQALCTLDGLNGLTPETLLRGLADSHPGVREQAARLSEKFLNGSEKLGVALLKLADDPEIRVRYQAAFSLGEWNDPRAGQALARIAMKDAGAKPLQVAVMSSATHHVDEMLAEAFAGGHPPAALAEQLIGLAVTLNDETTYQSVFRKIIQPQNGQFASWQMSALAGILDALDRRNTPLRRSNPDAEINLHRLFAQARATALDPAAPIESRKTAMRLLGRNPAEEVGDLKNLGQLLGPLTPPDLQQAALSALERNRGPMTALVLVDGWKGYLPETRLEVMSILLSRKQWTERLVSALENGGIPPGQIAASFQQKLLTHPQAEISARAKKIFTSANPDKKKLVADYKVVAGLKGDARAGAALFRQNCTPCHRLNAEGNSVGPDLGALANKSVETLLTAILDPNQAIESRYIAYNAVTKNDRELSGIIAAETPTSITLRGPGGVEEIILRNDLKELTSGGLSLMPEGLEKMLSHQGMADLLAFLNGGGAPAKNFPGNKPVTIKPESSGAIRLLPKDCEIYGDTLVLEEKYGNLGYWQSDNDHAVWNLDLPKGGAYDLWLDWAELGEKPRNKFQVQGDGVMFVVEIPGTGTFDDYRLAKLGRLQLKAGPQRLTFSGVPPLEGAILDLREMRLVPAGQSPRFDPVQ